jgi:hypothetical protein
MRMSADHAAACSGRPGPASDARRGQTIGESRDVDKPNWECEFRPLEIDELTARALLQAPRARGGAILGIAGMAINASMYRKHR